MTARDLRAACAPTTATIRDALEVVDRSGNLVCLLVDDENRLAGLLTDGDLRRAFLKGTSLDDAALDHATRTPHFVAAGSPRALVLDLMQALRISAVPELADDRTLVGLHTLSDVVGSAPLPNVAVVMAGGRGTRLGDLTKDTPKPLMTVAGRSILEWIVLGLVGDGIREIYVSVNYLAEQIEEHLGDGSRLGCTVRYLREDPERPLGTAGSLTLLRDERPDLEHAVLVMNGDLMVEFDASDLLDAPPADGRRRHRRDPHLPARGAVRRRREHRRARHRRLGEADAELRHQRRRVCRRAAGARLAAHRARQHDAGPRRDVSRARRAGDGVADPERLDRRRHPEGPGPREGRDVSARASDDVTATVTADVANGIRAHMDDEKAAVTTPSAPEQHR